MEHKTDPYTAPRSNVELATVDVKLPFFKSWLIFFLIVTVVGGIIGAVLGTVIGGMMGAAGVSIEVITWVSGVVGLVISLPISYFTFKWSVSKYLIGHPAIAEALVQKQD